MEEKNKTRNLAIIPARGGSKRIPRKNIKLFCGKPIIAYSIIAAQKSNLFDTIIVSTDDHEIAEIATRWGAEVPFMRPQNLSDDYATTLDVIKHVLEWTISKGMVYENSCCIYATAPFVRISDLKKGYELLKDKSVLVSFPITSFPSYIFRALQLTPNNRIKMFWPEYLNTRTQDLPEAYHDVGQFYWGKTNAFLKTNSIFDKGSSPVIIPRYLAQDIDTQEDWEQAELIHRSLYPEEYK
jgi:N-acylneuraminate cytidylyltransferase